MNIRLNYATWRPFSAINMADADGNDAIQIDATWKPVLPTPNHPEYPAAHSCTSGSRLGKRSAQWVASRHFGRQE